MTRLDEKAGKSARPTCCSMSRLHFDAATGISQIMGRWPDDSRSQLWTFLIMFVLFPLFCWLAWWFVKR